MKLHNTLTKQIEPITPLATSTVRIYSCGPTVYNHIHIGNLSSFIFADMLRRAVQANGFSVKHVMNFTDVDDKTIRASQEQYPTSEPLTALKKLTTGYSDIFLQDMQAVGNDIAAMTFVKATEAISGMQAMIRVLYTNGFAYIADDGVYFSIAAYKESGKIYGQLTEITSESTSEARIQNDEYDKASVHDFALWKTKKANEPSWEFELDGIDLTGRPGWHLECSVMSNESLGQPFDIHTGGIDLIFPHHENEIAQSTAGNSDATYAKHFVHNEHLLVDGKKMSKSLNNFYTLKDITNKGYDPLSLRVLVLQSHYRNQAHFSWDNLDAASNRLQDLRAMAALQYQARPQVQNASTIALDEVRSNLTKLLADDLATPGVLQFLSHMSTQLQATLLEDGNENPYNSVERFKSSLAAIDELLGLDLSKVIDISEEQKALIAERETARADGDWAKSDEIRDSLLTQGLQLRDTLTGAIWLRE